MQQEIIELLKKEKKELSLKQIAERLHADPSHVTKRISKLIFYREIKFIEIDKDKALKLYHCKRRMRLYYL